MYFLRPFQEIVFLKLNVSSHFGEAMKSSLEPPWGRSQAPGGCGEGTGEALKTGPLPLLSAGPLAAGSPTPVLHSQGQSGEGGFSTDTVPCKPDLPKLAAEDSPGLGWHGAL